MKIHNKLITSLLFCSCMFNYTDLFAGQQGGNYSHLDGDRAKTPYPDPGDLERVIDDFSITLGEYSYVTNTDDIPDSKKNDNDDNSGLEALCLSANNITYNKHDDINRYMSRGSVNDKNKRYLIVFERDLPINQVQGIKYYELFTPGYGFCFWNAAYGFNKRDQEFEAYFDRTKLRDFSYNGNKYNDETLLQRIYKNLPSDRTDPDFEGFNSVINDSKIVIEKMRSLPINDTTIQNHIKYLYVYLNSVNDQLFEKMQPADQDKVRQKLQYFVDICIPTLNELDKLRKLLETLLNNKLDNKDIKEIDKENKNKIIYYINNIGRLTDLQNRVNRIGDVLLSLYEIYSENSPNNKFKEDSHDNKFKEALDALVPYFNIGNEEKCMFQDHKCTFSLGALFKRIKETFGLALGDGVDSMKKVLGDSGYPFELYILNKDMMENTYSIQEDYKNNEYGKNEEYYKNEEYHKNKDPKIKEPIRIVFNGGNKHCSRLITEKELDTLRQIAPTKGVEVITEKEYVDQQKLLK